MDPRPPPVQAASVSVEVGPDSETAIETAIETANESELERVEARTPRSFLAKLPPLSEDTVLHVGIDENGLGPVLGPLIVTAVAFRTRGKRPTTLGSLVGDSKALVSNHDVSLGEAWARALLATLGPTPKSPAEVLARISLDSLGELQAPCPSRGDASHEPHRLCWRDDDDAFLADDAQVAACTEALERWAGNATGGRFARRSPLELAGIRASVVCVSRMNDAGERGRNKLTVDLHEMERLALALHAASPVPVPLDAVCGKVGGMGYYSDYFGPLSSRLHAIEAEGHNASAYRFPGLGRVTFLVDADATDPFVGLASLVGKYLRELMMGRVVHYLRHAATPETLPSGELATASGYRDPHTKRLILASAPIRAHRGVPDRCFQRKT